ncbi:MAG: hypothetical protein ACREQ5_29570 [Candidatus Dormibacteria bacterium]
MANVERLLEFDGIFEPALSKATSLSLDGIESAAQTYMWGTFINPTGPLEDAFEKSIEDGIGVLANTSPYALRRNDGFSGMTDSLGRYYPSDPGIHYMEFALQISEPFIETTFAIETETALASIGGG